MVNNVVTVTGVQQSDSVIIHIHVSILFQILFPFRLLHNIEQSSLCYTTVFLFFYKFIYFWLCWVFVAACGLSLVAASGGYSSLRCRGFLLWWLLLLWSTGSRHAGFSSCGSRALERRLSSCGTQA